MSRPECSRAHEPRKLFAVSRLPTDTTRLISHTRLNVLVLHVSYCMSMNTSYRLLSLCLCDYSLNQYVFTVLPYRKFPTYPGGAFGMPTILRQILRSTVVHCHALRTHGGAPPCIAKDDDATPSYVWHRHPCQQGLTIPGLGGALPRNVWCRLTAVGMGGSVGLGDCLCEYTPRGSASA